MKYVALDTLQQLLHKDAAAVMKHRETLLECLKVIDSPTNTAAANATEPARAVAASRRDAITTVAELAANAPTAATAPSVSAVSPAT